jgi:alpha-L-fucosidase
MFIHFGVNTFADLEWSDGKIPSSKYNPTELDCDQWARVAKEAGFKYVLLTVKHHDGFCLWDSKYTDYDVASSPIKTDVVKSLSIACRKYGIKFAIYYSLWDRHEATYTNPDTNLYCDYMKKQLTELLTNYGEVSELWFDGGWDSPVARWKLDELYKLVKKIQPYCAVGVNHTIVYEEGKRDAVLPDYMTKDNKYYFQYFPSDFRLWDPMIPSMNDKKQYLHQGKSYYLPFETTICLSKQWAWFAKSIPSVPRSVDELEELYHWCTLNNNTMLLDVPPAPNGRIRESDANQIIALGRRLKSERVNQKSEYSRPISLRAEVEVSSTYLSDKNEFVGSNAVDGGMQTRWATSDDDKNPYLIVHLDSSKSFNKISIFEYQDRVSLHPGDYFSMSRKSRIQQYSIDIWKNNRWESIYVDDESMGDCKVIRFPKSYQTSKIRLRVMKFSAPPSIKEFCVYATSI